ERRRPAPPPDADRVPFTAEVVGDVLVVPAVESEQDHLSPLSEGLGTRAGTGHGLQHFLLAFGNKDLGCPPWHGSDLLRVLEGGLLGEVSQSCLIDGRPIQPRCTRKFGWRTVARHNPSTHPAQEPPSRKA